jgi:hypothetical protein
MSGISRRRCRVGVPGFQSTSNRLTMQLLMVCREAGRAGIYGKKVISNIFGGEKVVSTDESTAHSIY